MVQTLRTGLIVLAACAAGWLACGRIVAGRAAWPSPSDSQPVGLRLGKGSAEAVSPARWQTPGSYYVLPGGRHRVPLRHGFPTLSDALRWAEESFGLDRTIAYYSGRCWCVVLIDKGLPFNAWDALLFSARARRGANLWRLCWISYGCVTIIDSGDWPDCAYVESDGCTLVFETRTGKKLSVTKLPSKLAYP